MSKPIAELLAAARPLEDRILSFLLSAEPGQAYSFPEIYFALEAVQPQLHQFFEAMWAAARVEGRMLGPPWGPALEHLVASGKVQKATMHGTDYYWAKPAGTP